MSKFFGKNNLNPTKDLIITKAQFKTQAYVKEGPEVFEFNFLEYQMYGAIDLKGSSIFPNPLKIQNFRTAPGQFSSYQAFDFVTKMYLDAKRNIQLAANIGQIDMDNPLLFNFDIVRAYESPIVEYNSHFNYYLIRFNNFISRNKTVRDNITSFDDYVKELMVFFKNNFQNKALTMSGFLQSNKNSIFTSGLAFSIADIDFDDDNKKYTQFMSTPSFEFYKKVLLNKGFKIWKHCPYVIVADIGSPAITRYLNTNIEDTLDNYYMKSYIRDYRLLYNNIIKYYNFFVTENPYKIKLNMGCVTRKTPIFRESKAIDDVDHSFWMKYYVDIRNIELGNVLGPSDIKKIKKYLKIYQNKLDNNQLIGYIDSMFRKETFKKSFGLADSYRRLLEVQKKRNQKEDITGESTIVGGTSGGY